MKGCLDVIQLMLFRRRFSAIKSTQFQQNSHIFLKLRNTLTLLTQMIFHNKNMQLLLWTYYDFSKEYILVRNVNLFLAHILLISHHIRVKANDGWIP